MSLTVAFITSRYDPKFDWFADSLRAQTDVGKLELIVVDLLLSGPADCQLKDFARAIITQPKPNLWGGASRITKQDWWHKASALNTAITLCRTDFIAFVDDRCVLGSKWMSAVKKAMKEQYAVCGAYEKRVGMAVTNGKITNPGTTIGRDHRRKVKRPSYVQTFGHDWFGCTNALPLEWALQVNGVPEDYTGGHGYEDTAFGKLLSNNHFPLQFDPDMLVIQDRTEGQCGPTMRREDVGKSPKDKSHRLVELMDTAKTSGNSYDLRSLRNNVLAGQPFPPPTASTTEWYTNTPIIEFQDRTFP